MRVVIPVEVNCTEKSRLRHTKSFMEWVSNHHNVALNGHPTDAQLGDYYDPWLLVIIYPGFGISTDNIPLPGESD